MHVHIAGSLNLDCVVVSSHSRHVQITSSSFNDWSMRKAVSICNSFNQPSAGNTEIRTADFARWMGRQPVFHFLGQIEDDNMALGHDEIALCCFNLWCHTSAKEARVLACHRQLHCCASAAHLPLLLVLVGYILADDVMQCLQPTPVLSGFP